MLLRNWSDIPHRDGIHCPVQWIFRMRLPTPDQEAMKKAPDFSCGSIISFPSFPDTLPTVYDFVSFVVVVAGSTQ